MLCCSTIHGTLTTVWSSLVQEAVAQQYAHDKGKSKAGAMILHDVQVVNFGAWYPRYSVLDPHHPWPAWQTDMKELINERLVSCKATTFWRSYAAAHYGGINGTNTFEEVSMLFTLQRMPGEMEPSAPSE